MSLEEQYKEFIRENPNYSHWMFNDWIRFHREEIGKIIEQIKENDRIWLENLKDE